MTDANIVRVALVPLLRDSFVRDGSVVVVAKPGEYEPHQQATAALAALVRLVAERDSWRETAEVLGEPGTMGDLLANSEARVTELEAALGVIADSAESCVNVDDTTLREEWVAEVARAALAAAAKEDA